MFGIDYVMYVFKKQMKKADKSGASVALILGDDEIANTSVSVKYLREQKEQQSVAWTDVPVLLKSLEGK